MSRKLEDLDRIDRQILRILQHAGRLPNVELARRVNLSPTPCLERVKRLEREGFIKEYVALLDPLKVHAGLVVYIQVSLTDTATEALEAFNKHLSGLEEVQECHMVAGGFDYLIKIRIKDMLGYRQFLGEKLASVPGVRETHTYVVIEEVKTDTSVAIPEPEPKSGKR
ncbi:Lrp/AsnC ligand binding domain-containing protein [Microbulbifer agarilyticus]|uniref:Lrp/AsnC ligand binding domain-containing protein n=1 Tax=Microbulbifer agarilyticus TaxID=260552 RepID=UPI001C93A93A|nr:Lrp/AsnC ligand binding domain-containing protein [Microbulbifer agarilyticus]MBY6189511.1 Lrp/AsnC ligand binding domain-containing protein [Microbulbifer agarilyticus]MBY6210783.1 Lrp/AsnC ligand binding domain-containing protein [Microbulbifer agarilyticus]MCA0892002.1 Lrp/AsnC ligand binding domain-containing protein [Microbulbifer agarilyticus]MCA0900948.1 Lrp/AsnC ligand binding domain-containing protein [Microbulbifer agarilyticus]